MVSSRSLRRSLAFVAMVSLFVGGLALAPGTAMPAGASAASTAESQFLTKLNQERVSRGLRALVLDSAWAGAARSWSGHMSATNTLSHDPNLSAEASAVDPRWRSIGENVGYGYSVQQLHDAFMASTGHRANILKAAYNRVGIGVVYNGTKIWVTVRFMEGPAIAGPTGLGATPPPGVRSALSGDFDGDGHDDLFVYGPGAEADEVWFGRADHSMDHVSVQVDGQYRPIAGDFDGDGRTEIIWYAPGSTGDYRWEWDGTGWSSKALTVNGTYWPQVGDFDGNGRDDILWYAPGTGSDASWYGNADGSFTGVSTTINGTYRPVVGDFDGNGGDDILWYAPGTAKDFYWYSSLGRGSFQAVGATINGTYTPFSADLDGTGTDDIFWYAAGGAADFAWYQYTAKGSYRSMPRTVSGTYVPSAGDFDDNGADDIVWFSPTSASGDAQWWGIRQSMTYSSGLVTAG